ncbi:DUF4357 domain-containing protein [Celerinatantimonas diazotrophica]|uniref:Uncharacterized protein DUF4357 n=1 Tax=Celerinatantimonas diazotrophica TaxID=412034 RepID=A0A4R1J8A0_9GAMM|nr:DUF4357 domain-containing protein [Celerinatantimonas diazotrophica]TCK46805.1 uncharacterized protein DUF4357 [Celerinatantimonas diazotrophica]CAG9295508.1 hypothetical protein CEDIAZO_00624 [Celerinatantimonas diazotrophica]
MDNQLDTSQVSFIVDTQGHRQAAIIPMNMYQQLLALQQLLDEEGAGSQLQADFHFEVKQAKAYGYPVGSKTRPNFVVTKGSTANLGLTDSMRPAVRELRAQLLADFVLVEGPENYEFLRDYQFASPSLAACLIAGNARSGLDAWHDQWGRTLKDRGYGKKRPTPKKTKSS